jgi:hypothetical protein
MGYNFWIGFHHHGDIIRVGEEAGLPEHVSIDLAALCLGYKFSGDMQLAAQLCQIQVYLS